MTVRYTRRDVLKSTAAIGAAFALGPVACNGEQSSVSPNDVQAFFSAAGKGDVEAVRRLLGAHPELLTSRNERRQSAYAVSLLNGHSPVAEVLAKAGHQSDLHEAALAGDWERFDKLSEDAGDTVVKVVNSDHPVGGTAMYAAAAGGVGADIWRVYAKCGLPDESPRGADGVTPLQAALRYRDLSSAEIGAATLLGNDADPNPPANADSPPLHIAAERGSRDLVEMLIRLGARIDAADRDGRTAQQVSEKQGHAPVARLLKAHGTIPRTCRTSRTAFDKDGKPYTPPRLDDIPDLKRGAIVGQSHGNLDAVKEGVAADPRLAHSVATTSESCVEAGAHMGRRDMVDFLLGHGAPYSLPTAVMMGDTTTVKRLLDQDPERLHERGAHDFALLWYPIIGKTPIAMLELLLDRGAKVEEQHFLGTTALHWAVMRDRLAEAELLLERGADPNRVGRKFPAKEMTPLQAARGGDPKIEKLLRAHGAK